MAVVVDAALSLAVGDMVALSFAGGGICDAGETITVRVAEPVRPAGSVEVETLVIVIVS